MASDVTADDFKRLATRVDIVEREVDGEKLVTRHVLEQTRRNSDDLAAIKTRLERVERAVGEVDHKVDGLANRVDGLANRFDAFVRNFPKIVGDVVREVMRERKR